MSCPAMKRHGGDSGDFTTDITDMQGVLRDYCQQLYANKLDNLEQIGKFLETYNLQKLNRKRKP